MTDFSEVSKWYIIHTHSGFETKVIMVLKEEIRKKNLDSFFYRLFSSDTKKH
jgi:transcription antitermination factor NusG